MNACIGWDVGGANLKAVAIGRDGAARLLERPFEIWRAPEALEPHLAEMSAMLGGAPLHALTTTAELADCFATKRDGVRRVVDAAERALGGRVRVFGLSGFRAPESARRQPLLAAAANWCAAACWLSAEVGDVGLLVDVGSTTADLVPFAGGHVLARGRTDPERLLAGELVYTGALRTPICAIVRTVPMRGAECPVAAEHFAIAADAHLWLGSLEPAAYTCPTPDAGPATREGAAARLARVVCGDRELLSDGEITAIARRVAEAQATSLVEALDRLARRLFRSAGTAPFARDGRSAPAGAAARATQARARVWIAGSGGFLAEAAARRLGLRAERLADRIGEPARALPAYAAARLLLDRGGRAWHAASGREGKERTPLRPGSRRAPTLRAGSAGPRVGTGPARPGALDGGHGSRGGAPPVVDTVVKLGGSLARHGDALRDALRVLSEAGSALVVPGGGPLADAVRAIWRSSALPDRAAHRMALLSVDQSALWMAGLVSPPGASRVVASPRAIREALAAEALPVLAPARWVDREDPLPATWEVTSDSVAAWVAGRIGARRLLLLKSFRFRTRRVAAGELGDAVDAFFLRALPAGLECRFVDGRDPAQVRAALRGQQGAGTLLVRADAAVRVAR